MLPSLMAWVLVTAVGTLGRLGQCKVPASTVPPSYGGLKLHNKMHPTSLGIVSISSLLALASPGYYLESFSPEGSEQMRFISMVITRVSQESRFF